MRPLLQIRHGVLATLTAVVLCGCQGMGRHKMAAAEPALETAPGGATTIVDAQPAKQLTWVDRHPIASAPRDIYESTNSNKFVKVAAATVVGVPVGVFGEVKQIVVGTPPDLRQGH